MAATKGVAFEELLHGGPRIEQDPVAVRGEALRVVGGFDGAAHFEGGLEVWSRGGEVREDSPSFHLGVFTDYIRQKGGL